MKAWLRALIDGLACIGSFGQLCGERRAPNLWAMTDAEQVEYIRRYLTQADLDTITSDWRLVGDDLRAAIKTEQSNTIVWYTEDAGPRS